jgi:hypothetical protein
MEIIEGALWMMTGFIPTLVSMELAWRIAKKGVRDRLSIDPLQHEDLLHDRRGIYSYIILTNAHSVARIQGTSHLSTG